MPRIHVHYSKWTWVLRLAVLAVAALATFPVWVRGYSAKDLPLLITTLNPWWWIFLIRQHSTAYLLFEDVLVVRRDMLGIQYVPLAVAKPTVRGRTWTFRWKEGNRYQSVRVFMPPELRGPVEGAFASLPEHPAKTEAEATTRLQVALTLHTPTWVPVWFGTWAFLLVAAIVTGLLLRNPLPGLAPFLMLLGTPIWSYPPVLAWSGDMAWLLKDKTEPHPIPLAKVTGVRTTRRKGVILTSDPNYPELQVLTVPGDFIKALERRGTGAYPM